jgi:hypothetical protein
MDKIKITLTLLSIAIVVGPLAGMAIIYRDDLSGLVIPPEIKNITNGEVNDSSPSNFVTPTLANDPQYNPDTGEFNVDFNFTNPLSNQISVEQFSADLKSSDTNIDLGHINLNQPINIAPGENGIIDVSGILNQDTINQIKAQYDQTGYVNVVLENVNAQVAGVTFHLDRLDLGSLDLGSMQVPEGLT